MSPKAKSWLTALVAVCAVVGLAIVVVTGPRVPGRPAPGGVVIGAPALDEPVPAAPGTETAVFAGGCFWGVQGVYEHVRGVTQALSGYTGGGAATAHYDEVSTGETGHAEAVRITYDPSQVSYGQLLRIFFSVVHDPTELDYQGPDSGSQYRSAVFPQNDMQERIVRAYLAQLAQAKVFDAPIVTSTERAQEFFPAEQHHQDFLNSNPTYPYIAINDVPKVEDLKRLFPDLYRDDPVLVLASHTP